MNVRFVHVRSVVTTALEVDTKTIAAHLVVYPICSIAKEP